MIHTLVTGIDYPLELGVLYFQTNPYQLTVWRVPKIWLAQIIGCPIFVITCNNPFWMILGYPNLWKPLCDTVNPYQ